MRIFILCSLFWLLHGALLAQVHHYPREFRMKAVAFHGDTCWVEVAERGDAHAHAYVLQIVLSTGKATELAPDAYMAWHERASQNVLWKSHQVLMEEKGSKFVYPITQLTVKPPPYSADLFNIYHEELKFACPEGWNNAMGASQGIVEPKIEAQSSPQLRYAFSQGLYFNYEIQKCFYFPDVRVLVVFTANKIKCNHQAPADGFLIFKF